MDAYTTVTNETFTFPQFEEKQKFTQWWIWALLSIVTLLGIVKIMIKEWNRENVDIVLFCYTGFCFLMLLFFFLLQLHTKIDQKEIYIRYFPFVKKHIPWSEIASAKVIHYGFVGGWGIRIKTPYGTVYNTRGEEGLAIVLKNGKRFLIGTQRPEEMSLVVDALLKQAE